MGSQGQGLVERFEVKLLERLSEFADVVRGTALKASDLTLRHPFGAEDAAQVLEERVAVLDIYERTVKGAV